MSVVESKVGQVGRWVATVVALVACARPISGADSPMYQRVSVASDGTQANGPSGYPALSGNGRCVAYASAASNLVASDTNDLQDIFVFDLVTRTTTRESVAGGGAQADAISVFPAISDDCRFVIFQSAATNLVAGATGTQIYLRDRAAGTTTLVSASNAGAPANAPATEPAISGDGRVVTFTSTASNLVAGDTNERADVFTRDLARGVTSRESVSPSGEQGDSVSTAPALSGDGRYVVFRSTARNLVRGMPDADPLIPFLFVRDRTTGETTVASTLCCPESPAVSADSRRIVFQAGNGIVLRDRMTGAISELESFGFRGLLYDYSDLRISADGRYVSYLQYRHPCACLPSPPRTVLVDTATGLRWDPSTSGFSAFTGSNGFSFARVAANLLAFASDSSALVDRDTNGVNDVFVADLAQASPPGAPQNLHLTVVGSNVVLSWSPPVDGGRVSTYRISVALTSQAPEAVRIIDTTTDATDLTVPAPSDGPYYLRVYSVNAFGVSVASNEVVYAPGSVPPVPQPRGSGTPRDLAASVSGSTVTLSWNAPTAGTPATQYQIDAGLSFPGAANLGSVPTGTARSLTAPGVPAGMYFARVRAVEGGVVGPASNEVSFIVLSASAWSSRPTAPTGLTATVSGSTVNLSWTAPASSIASYVLEAGSAAGLNDLASLDMGSVATRFTAAGVARGTYFVRVFAKSACGTSPASNEVVVRVEGQ